MTGEDVSVFRVRRDGRVVEGGGLENRWRGNSLLGSNPSPSAILQLAHLLQEFQIFSRSNGEYRGYDRDRFNDAWLRYGVTSQGEIEPSIRHKVNKSRAG